MNIVMMCDCNSGFASRITQQMKVVSTVITILVENMRKLASLYARLM